MAKKTGVPSTQVAFRCPDYILAQLDELCQFSGTTRGQFFIECISSEYDKLQGNPKLKEMLETMKQLAEQAKALSGRGNANV